MKRVHVECLHDEALIKRLGFARKDVEHHRGKSKVFRKLKSVNNQLALVDEDPGSTKSPYEKKFKLLDERNGVKLFSDQSGNKILILKGKLEDWIIAICKKAGIKLADYGLPEKPNDLHGVINQRLTKFEDLIQYLLDNKNVDIHQLKDWLS